MGSIAASAKSDCTGNPDGARPKDNGNRLHTPCSFTQDNTGINRGTTSGDTFIANSVLVFSDDKCGEPVAEISNEDQPAQGKRGTNACVSQRANKGPWKSFIFIDY